MNAKSIDNKLNIKDLINTGIFTAMYLTIFFISGFLGYFPLFFMLMPLYIPVLCSIPFMLFLTKVKKPGMVTIMAVLIGTFMFVTGHTVLPVISGLLFGAFADFILYKGQYKKTFNITVGYIVFILSSLGALLPLWIMRENYLNYIELQMGTDYAQFMRTWTAGWAAGIPLVLSVAGGIAGSYLGRKILNKHFKRAGIA